MSEVPTPEPRGLPEIEQDLQHLKRAMGTRIEAGLSEAEVRALHIQRETLAKEFEERRALAKAEEAEDIRRNEELLLHIEQEINEHHIPGFEEPADADEPGDEPPPEEAGPAKPKGRFESAMESLGKGFAAMMEKIGPALKKLGEIMEMLMNAMKKAFAPLVPSLIKMGVQPPEWMMDRTPGMKEITDAAMKNNRTLKPSDRDEEILRKLANMHKDISNAVSAKGGSYSMDQFMTAAVMEIDESKKEITFTDVLASAEQVAADEKARAAALPAPAPAGDTAPAKDKGEAAAEQPAATPEKPAQTPPADSPAETPAA